MSQQEQICTVDMSQLMDVPETADFTLKVGHKSFKVHKAVLVAMSGVFRAMFHCGMKEHEVLMTDVEEECLEEILHYLYLYDIAMEKFKKNKKMLKDKKFEEKVKKYPDLLYKLFVSTNE